MGTGSNARVGDTKVGTTNSPSHSPDMLLGVVGASYQAGDQVCKAGTPQGEGPPPTPGHPEGQGRLVPRSLQPLVPHLHLCLGLGSQLTWGSRVLWGVPVGWVVWVSLILGLQ